MPRRGADDRVRLLHGPYRPPGPAAGRTATEAELRPPSNSALSGVQCPGKVAGEGAVNTLPGLPPRQGGTSALRLALGDATP